MKVILILLILWISGSLCVDNRFLQKGRNQTNAANRVIEELPKESKVFAPVFAQTSSTYQKQQNPEESLHGNVLSSLNSKIPLPPHQGKDGLGSYPVQDGAIQSESVLGIHGSKYLQSKNFEPSKFLGNRYPSVVSSSSGGHYSSPLKSLSSVSQEQQVGSELLPKRGNLAVAQRRNDGSYGGHDSQYETYSDQNYGHPGQEYSGNYEESTDGEYEGYANSPPNVQYGNVEVRQDPLGFGTFPGTGPGFVGPAALDPLPFPPPPVPLKGSIDYILIPLILIGLAGPIFVVLYVILGAFEAKLSPITSIRSLSGLDAYMPNMESLSSTVSRAIDDSECLDYAACQLGSLCNRVGLVGHPTISQTLDAMIPTTYKRQVRTLMSAMKEPRSCSINGCIKF